MRRLRVYGCLAGAQQNWHTYVVRLSSRPQ